MAAALATSAEPDLARGGGGGVGSGEEERRGPP